MQPTLKRNSLSENRHAFEGAYPEEANDRSEASLRTWRKDGIGPIAITARIGKKVAKRRSDKYERGRDRLESGLQATDYCGRDQVRLGTRSVTASDALGWVVFFCLLFLPIMDSFPLLHSPSLHVPVNTLDLDLDTQERDPRRFFFVLPRKFLRPSLFP